jgi:hypothetical protein
MGIRTHCPNGHKLNIKAFQAGQRGICPICGARFDIPYQSTRKSAKELEAEQGPGVAPQQPAGTTPASQLDPGAAPLPNLPVGPSAATGPQTGASSPQTTHPSDTGPAPEYELTLETEDLAASQGVADGASAGQAPAPTVSGASGPGPTAPQPSASPADPLAEAPHAVWYVRPPSGGQYGPAAVDVMRSWIGEGRVSPDSLVWREGWRDWRQAGEVFRQLNPRSRFPDFGAGTGGVARSAYAAEGSYRATSHSRANNSAILITLLVVVVVCLIAVFIWVLTRGSNSAYTPPVHQSRIASTASFGHSPFAAEVWLP